MNSFLDLNLDEITEGTKETTSKCPSVDITAHVDADNSGNHEIPVPGGIKETPNAKPYDANSIPVPGGDNEAPDAKPYDGESGVPNPASVLLDEDEYNSALEALKKSFTEGADILDMLMNSRVQHKSVEAKQSEFVEAALDEAFYNAMCSGPIFEAVQRKDKNEVKELVDTIREDVFKFIKNQKFKVYKPSVIGRLLSGIIGTPVLSLNAVAAVAQIWKSRLWQTVGVVIVDDDDALKKALNEEFKDQLGEYKIVLCKAPKAFLDVFRTKFNWKNTLHPFFIMIDKKMPAEITKATKAADDEYEAANKETVKEEK